MTSVAELCCRRTPRGGVTDSSSSSHHGDGVLLGVRLGREVIDGNGFSSSSDQKIGEGLLDG